MKALRFGVLMRLSLPFDKSVLSLGKLFSSKVLFKK
jgi:hypothetical protein